MEFHCVISLLLSVLCVLPIINGHRHLPLPGHQHVALPGHQHGPGDRHPRPPNVIGGNCLQRIDPGPCLLRQVQYAFDSNKKECVSFIYGGCLGNGNRFYSLRQCNRTCWPYVKTVPQTVTNTTIKPTPPVISTTTTTTTTTTTKKPEINNKKCYVRRGSARV